MIAHQQVKDKALEVGKKIAPLSIDVPKAIVEKL